MTPVNVWLSAKTSADFRWFPEITLPRSSLVRLSSTSSDRSACVTDETSTAILTRLLWVAQLFMIWFDTCYTSNNNHLNEKLALYHSVISTVPVIPGTVSFCNQYCTCNPSVQFKRKYAFAQSAISWFIKMTQLSLQCNKRITFIRAGKLTTF